MSALSKFIRDLRVIENNVQDRKTAEELYSALCNNDVYDNSTGEVVTMTWRCAADLVAHLRNQDEDYLDYYCSGNEGTVTDSVRELLRIAGYTIR
jgi:hypothetical protein